jgi:hypothetical protein
MAYLKRGLGQAPLSCPSGYTYSNPGNSVIPAPVPSGELAALQGAFCIDPSGRELRNVQGVPIAVASGIAAVGAAVFLPGLFKILALPLGLYAYCSVNTDKCILSL